MLSSKWKFLFFKKIKKHFFLQKNKNQFKDSKTNQIYSKQEVFLSQLQKNSL